MASKLLLLAVITVMLIFPSLEATPIQTTLDGPFTPVTVSFPDGHRGAHASVDLPANDPRVIRHVTGIFPEQISVALSTHGSAWISWITGKFQIGNDVKPLDASSVGSVVKYGASEDNLSNEASGYSLVYSQLYPFAGLQNYTSGIIHRVRLTDSPIHETYQPRWDYWGRFMEPLISQVPIMVVEGNHEIEEQVEHKMFTAYQSRFAFPSEESGSRSPFYYSFDAGGIHFVMIGGYIDYNKTGEQYRWLESDLANVDRSVTPWLVATWHPPWYSSYRAHYREADCMRQEMEELLYKYGVDIVFNGHVHAYERSNRVFNYTLDPCAPVYITIGDGGNRENIVVHHADDPGNCPEPSSTPYAFMGGLCAYNFTSGPAAGKFCWDRQPDFSAYRESSFGHGILEVKNETYALWTWHRNQDAYNSKGDQIYIVRQPGVCANQPKVFQSIPSFFKRRKYRRIEEDTMVARAAVVVLMLTLVLWLLGARLAQR